MVPDMMGANLVRYWLMIAVRYMKRGRRDVGAGRRQMLYRVKTGPMTSPFPNYIGKAVARSIMPSGQR